jgi:hypothetical protein
MSNQKSEHTLGMTVEPQAGHGERTNASPNKTATDKADPHSYLGRSPPAATAPKDAQRVVPDPERRS